MLRAGVTQFSEMSAGPDNPTGRMDVAYHLFLATLRAEPEKIVAEDFDRLSDLMRRDLFSELKARVRTSTSDEEVAAAIRQALRLEHPSEALSRGIQAVAERALSREISSLREGIRSAEARISAIEASRLPAVPSRQR